MHFTIINFKSECDTLPVWSIAINFSSQYLEM